MTPGAPPERADESQAERAAREEREPPPVLGSWGRLYVLVLATLGAVVLVLLWLRETFS